MLPLFMSFLSAALADPTVSVSGTCPGPVSIDVNGVTPSGRWALFTGNGPGADVIPSGPCAGTVSGLSGLVSRVKVYADVAGHSALSPSLPAHGCGLDVQVVDLTTCTQSAVGSLPTATPDSTYVSEGRTVQLFKTDSAAALGAYNTFCENQGLAWFTPKTAVDAQTLITNAYNIDVYHTWVITHATTSLGTFGGFPVVVDSPECVGYSASGPSAIRKWGCSYCDPELYGTTACWDAHVYDWAVCE